MSKDNLQPVLDRLTLRELGALETRIAEMKVRKRAETIARLRATCATMAKDAGFAIADVLAADVPAKRRTKPPKAPEPRAKDAPREVLFNFTRARAAVQ